MNEKLVKILDDVEERHSDFQIENFIIGKQGDAWAQYRQSLIEIKSRCEQLAKLKKNRAVIMAAKSQRPPIWVIWYRKLKLFLLGVVRVDLQGIEQADIIKDNDRKIEMVRAELACFEKIAYRLKDQIGEIDAERRQELEAESWENKGRRMAAIDILCVGRLQPQTADFILSLPAGSAISLIEEIKQTDARILYYKSKGMDEHKIRNKLQAQPRKRLDNTRGDSANLHNGNF